LLIIVQTTGYRYIETSCSNCCLCICDCFVEITVSINKYIFDKI